MSSAHSYTIINATTDNGCVAQIRQWFEAEWGQIDAVDNPATPAPLAAIDAAGQPVGGLAFTTSKSPNSDHEAIWINAVYVLPEHRNQGLGGELIAQASADAELKEIRELYVSTNIPKIYEALGWQIINSNENQFTLFFAVERISDD